MRFAASLLAANALSIEQVTHYAGYQSRSSFTRAFRKQYGTDPSDYRARANGVVVAYEIEEENARNDYPPSAIKPLDDAGQSIAYSTPFQNAI